MKTDKMNYLQANKVRFNKKQSGALQHIFNNAVPSTTNTIEFLRRGLKERNLLNSVYYSNSLQKLTFADLLEWLEHLPNVCNDLTEYSKENKIK